ncbi:hypothetical protein [Mediterraneibacter agrestimuris]|nr:hypothetical protein [Mediterraneibacter agrestimuris]
MKKKRFTTDLDGCIIRNRKIKAIYGKRFAALAKQLSLKTDRENIGGYEL